MIKNKVKADSQPEILNYYSNCEQQQSGTTVASEKV